MNIRQELMAARTTLETIRAAKCDMPTKISGQEANKFLVVHQLLHL